MKFLSYLFVATVAALVGCSPQGEEGVLSRKTDGGRLESLGNPTAGPALRVVDEMGVPIHNASVLVGFALDEPFSGNFYTSDDKGDVIVPQDWVSGLPVTIEAPGYLRATFYDQLPQGQSFALRSADQNESIEVKGDTRGYGRLVKDGVLDVGIVLPAATRGALIQFDMSSFISPEVDILDIMGQQIALPSNIAIPKQTESYIFPITFDKSGYRLFFRSRGIERVMAVHIRFPFKTVIDGVRNGSDIISLANEFQFVGGSIKDLEVTKSAMQDLTVDEIAFNKTIGFNAPRFSSNHSLLTFGLVEKEGYLYPTDIKNPVPGKKIDLRAFETAGSAQRVLAVLRKKAEGDDMKNINLSEMSTIFYETPSSEAEFLDIIEPPTLSSNGELSMSPPRSVKGVAEVATYALLSDVEKKKADGGVTVEIKSRRWEFYSLNWHSDLKIPIWPSERSQKNVLRWEILYLGDSKEGQSVELGPQLLESVSHVSRNSIDL